MRNPRIILTSLAAAACCLCGPLTGNALAGNAYGHSKQQERWKTADQSRPNWAENKRASSHTEVRGAKNGGHWDRDRSDRGRWEKNRRPVKEVVIVKPMPRERVIVYQPAPRQKVVVRHECRPEVVVVHPKHHERVVVIKQPPRREVVYVERRPVQVVRKEKPRASVYVSIPIGSVRVTIGGEVFHQYRGGYYKHDGKRYHEVARPRGAYIEKMPRIADRFEYNGRQYWVLDGDYYTRYESGYRVCRSPWDA